MSNQRIADPGRAPEPHPPLNAQDGFGAQMGFFEHLDELRMRLIRVLLVLIVALVAATAFAEPLLNYLITPCGCELVLLRPTDSVVMYFRVALMAAAIVTVPTRPTSF
ncbi:MAG: preprotein translocase subunit TatC [Anaerolineae bacterium]|nr:preprotein translocase subunit TatC [Anaerolineae bacterium]